jgi:glycogen synthase
VFTIHNMDFGEKKLGDAAYFSQRFTTVSPTYAWEVGGRAGQGLLRARWLNGGVLAGWLAGWLLPCRCCRVHRVRLSM